MWPSSAVSHRRTKERAPRGERAEELRRSPFPGAVVGEEKERVSTAGVHEGEFVLLGRRVLTVGKRGRVEEVDQSRRSLASSLRVCKQDARGSRDVNILHSGPDVAYTDHTSCGVAVRGSPSDSESANLGLQKLDPLLTTPRVVTGCVELELLQTENRTITP